MNSNNTIEQLYQRVEEEYKGYSESLAAGEITTRELGVQLADMIAGDNAEFESDLNKAFTYIIDKFDGQVRKDGKTPVVLHSMYLPVILHRMGGVDLDSYLTALTHDLIEDTNVTISDLEELQFESQQYPVSSYVPYLSENKTLSKKPNESGISPRISSFIEQLKEAPTPVINTEIADRLNDLSDLGYLDKLPIEERNKEIYRKLMKCKNIVYNITENVDCNQVVLATFKHRVSQLEKIIGKEATLVS